MKDELMRISESIRINNDNFLDDMDNIIKLDTDIVSGLNCYAYSLGIREKRQYWYPGFTNKGIDQIESFWNEEILKNNILDDIYNLGLSGRVYEIGEKFYSKEGEIIKVFLAEKSKDIPRGDFHMIRRSRGKWLHKKGWWVQPDFTRRYINNYEDTILGEELDLIKTSCTVKGYKEIMVTYKPVCYVVLNV